MNKTKFSTGVLKEVQKLGGQFSDAKLISIPGGLTLKKLRDKKITKFWSEWLFDDNEQDKLKIEPTTATEVIYLSNLIEGSLNKTYEETKKILTSLPKIEGLKWIIPTSTQLCYILGEHYKKEKKYLLESMWGWTTNNYKYSVSLYRLIAGYFNSGRVYVYGMRPDESGGNIGLFVLGVPSLDIGKLDIKPKPKHKESKECRCLSCKKHKRYHCGVAEMGCFVDSPKPKREDILLENEEREARASFGKRLQETKLDLGDILITITRK